MSYPTSIDSIQEPSPTSPTNNPSASGVSTAQTNAIVALETKLGTGASTPTSGTVMVGNGTGTSEWGATTGSGNVVLANSPTLVTPALGTPSSGVATNLTGTASGLTAGNVTTNANLTGPITSSGNATSVASQTGTGSKFVMDTSPTLVTPNLGTPASGTMTNVTGIPFAALLSTIFSGQVSPYTNTGSGGGTGHYINLGGIKLCWGNSSSFSATTATNYTASLPASIFTSIQFAFIGLYNPSSVSLGTAPNSSVPTTSTLTIFISGSAGVTTSLEWFVIGT
jgi:hypothetical protein